MATRCVTSVGYRGHVPRFLVSGAPVTAQCVLHIKLSLKPEMYTATSYRKYRNEMDVPTCNGSFIILVTLLLTTGSLTAASFTKSKRRETMTEDRKVGAEARIKVREKVRL